MKIRDITVRDIREGKNWRFLVPDDGNYVDLPMEEWGPIQEAKEFVPQDHVLYSGITVYRDGRVKPIVCLKEVQYLDYGGDYCEYVNGGWQQLGLRPNPNVQPSDTYIANPLEIDPSFDAPDHDFRKAHRDGFWRHVAKLATDA